MKNKALRNLRDSIIVVCTIFVYICAFVVISPGVFIVAFGLWLRTNDGWKKCWNNASGSLWY